MASSPVVVSKRQSLWGRTIAQLSRDLGAWLYVAVVLGLVTVLAFTYLAQASYVARQIEKMVKLEQRLGELHEENSALLLRIAKYEELSRIKSEAQAMGLGEAKHVEYVEVVLEEATPGPQGDAVRELPTGANSGGQQAVPPKYDTPLTIGSLPLAPTIVQQFQGWIRRGTSGREGE
jgi:hypothetical protein